MIIGSFKKAFEECFFEKNFPHSDFKITYINEFWR